MLPSEENREPPTTPVAVEDGGGEVEQSAGGELEPGGDPSAAVEEDGGLCAEVKEREGVVPTTGGEAPVGDMSDPYRTGPGPWGNRVDQEVHSY